MSAHHGFKFLGLLVLILLMAAPAMAQDISDCTSAHPCGPVPWRIPQLPMLVTPTSVPSSSGAVSAIFGATPVPAPEQAGALGDTSFFDGDALNDEIGTLNDLMSNNESVNGSQEDLVALASQSADFLGYVRAFSTANFGVFTPLLLIFILSFSVKMGAGLSLRLLPLVAVIFGLIRKAITVVLDFIPL